MEKIDPFLQQRIEAAQGITKTVYILQGLSFLFGLTGIVAVIINHIKYDDVRGTWLESHFRWQVRTFWIGLLWAVCGIVTLIFLVGILILIADYIWVIYRVVKGWIRFTEKKPMYSSSWDIKY